jgi:hypothetical protein
MHKFALLLEHYVAGETTSTVSKDLKQFLGVYDEFERAVLRTRLGEATEQLKTLRARVDELEEQRTSLQRQVASHSAQLTQAPVPIFGAVTLFGQSSANAPASTEAIGKPPASAPSRFGAVRWLESLKLHEIAARHLAPPIAADPFDYAKMLTEADVLAKLRAVHFEAHVAAAIAAGATALHQQAMAPSLGSTEPLRSSAFKGEAELLVDEPLEVRESRSKAVVWSTSSNGDSFC